MFFCEVSFAQKYSEKVIINPKIKKQFKYRDTCVAVFDAFKDCRCFLDTAKKTITIEAGEADGGGAEYLHFKINSNLKVKAEHFYDSDVGYTGVADPYPPFQITDFLIEANKNPFENYKKGFLIKYKLGENRRASSFFPDKSYEFTGFVNCHHITVHAKEHKRLSLTDSLNLMTTFLKSKSLRKALEQLSLKPFEKISGYVQEWKLPIPNYNLISNYSDFIHSKDRILSIVFIPPNNQILNGSQTIAWKYWENGVAKDVFGTFYYQKFKDKWILMQTFIYNLKITKRIKIY